MRMLHVYPCTHMNTCTHTYAQAHAHMHMHRHVHTHTHTCTQPISHSQFLLYNHIINNDNNKVNYSYCTVVYVKQSSEVRSVTCNLT